MKYAEFLSKAIEDSGMTLEQIAHECVKRGVKIHPTYIGKLRNGQRPAPSEDISRALAEVLGCDAEKLILLGYIEKAPESVRKILSFYMKNLDGLLQVTASLFIDPELSDEEAEREIKNIVNKVRQWPIEEQFNFGLLYLHRIFAARPDVFREFVQKPDMTDEELERIYNVLTQSPFIRLSTFNYKGEEVEFDWISASKITHGDYFYFIVPDDSMINAGIPKGARVLCKYLDSDYYDVEDDEDAEIEIDSGKLYLLKDKNTGHLFVRRVFTQDDGNVLILQPENPKYQPQVITNSDDAIPIAWVVSVEFNPNAPDSELNSEVH